MKWTRPQTTFAVFAQLVSRSIEVKSTKTKTRAAKRGLTSFIHAPHISRFYGLSLRLCPVIYLVEQMQYAIYA